MPHAKLTFVDVAGHEPAKDILSSKLDMEDIAWLYESNHAIQTCLSRHLCLQQADPKPPLEVPYTSSKVMPGLACNTANVLGRCHGAYMIR